MITSFLGFTGSKVETHLYLLIESQVAITHQVEAVDLPTRLVW